MRPQIRKPIWLVLLMIISLVTSGTSAQEDTPDWIVDLIPNASTEGVIDKLLAQAPIPLTSGELLLTETFDTPDAWEIFEASAGETSIENGYYRIVQGAVGAVLWGQYPPEHDNAIIEVETEQLSTSNNNGYGIMCRAHPNNNSDGYYFNISGNGSYNIRMRQNRQVTDLIEDTPSSVINQGQAINRIMAVCFEDLLALYVNGVFIDSVRDNTFERGFTGLSAFSTRSTAPTDITFDNLRIWSVMETDETTVPIGRPANPQQALITQLEQGNTPIIIGELLREETFDSADSWPESSRANADLRVADSVYRMTSGSTRWSWSVDPEIYNSGVIVQVTINQLSEELNNGYGIICNGISMASSTGYYLNISGDGFASLFASDGNDFITLQGWTPNDAINQGGENILTAVCVEDYLALYANGVLLYEMQDTRLPRGGLGFALVGYDDNIVVDLTYDNLRIWSASLGG